MKERHSKVGIPYGPSKIGEPVKSIWKGQDRREVVRRDPNYSPELLEANMPEDRRSGKDRRK